MFLRASATAWFVVASGVATALGAAGAGLRTDRGRDVLTRFGVSVLDDVLHGTAEVGEIAGSLTEGLDARDVVIRGEDGVLLARLPRVQVDYRFLDFLMARIAISRVTLTEPHINIIKGPNGRFNYQDVLGLGLGESEGGGAPPLVAMREASIVGGSVLIRTPTDPPTDRPFAVEDTPEGLMRVRRIDDLNAWVSYARIVSPFPGEDGLEFNIDSLSAFMTDPELDIRAMTGRLLIDGDSLHLDLDRFALPGSNARVEGFLKWPGGALQLGLDIDADRWTTDAGRPFVRRLPWGLEGDGRLQLRSLDARRLSVLAEPLRLWEPGGRGRLSGVLDMLVTRGAWTLRDGTHFTFDSLNIDYFRPMMDTLPFAGRLTGTFDGTGSADAVDARIDWLFADATVPEWPTTYIRGAGGLGLGGDEGLSFDGFQIDSADVALATVRRLLPVVELTGRMRGTGRLGGAWTNVSYSGSLRHRAEEGVESVARGTLRLDSRADTIGVWANLQLDSVRLAGLHPSYPRVPAGGVFAGGFWLEGFTDSLTFRANLTGPPGQVVARGALKLLPSEIGVRDLNASLRRFDVTRLYETLPPTELYGTIEGTFGRREDHGAAGRLAFAFDTSFVAGSEVDSLRGGFGMGDGQLRFDRLSVWGPGVAATSSGSLGLAETTAGDLTVRFAIDSLGSIAPLVADRFPAAARDSMLDDLDGAMVGEIGVTGNVVASRTRVDVSIPLAVSTGLHVEGLQAQASWPSVPDGELRIVATVDTLAKRSLGFSDLSLDVAGRRDASRWDAHARIGVDASWAARGGATVDGNAIRMPIELFGLLTPVNRWFADPGAVVTVSDSGIDFANVTLRSENDAAHVELSGRIPRSGPGSATGSIVGVPVKDVWGIIQRDVNDVEGRIGGRFALSGTARVPRWQSTLQLTDGRLGSFRMPMLEGTLDYADQRLRGEYRLFRLGEQILGVDFDLPMDLGFVGVDERQLPGRILVNGVADGVDLAFMELVTRTITGARGTLDARVGVTGTWERPELTGTVQVTEGGASFPALGVTHQAINGEWVLRGDTIRFEHLSIQSGEGRAEIGGFVRLEGLTTPMVNLSVSADEFHTIDVPDFMTLTTTADLSVTGPIFGASLTGRGTVTDGVVHFADLIEKQIVNLEDTLFASLIDTSLIRREGLTADFENRLLDSLRIDSLTLEMGSSVWLRSNEANVQLTGQVSVGKIAQQYQIAGTLNTPRGTYRLPLGRSSTPIIGDLVVREFTVSGGQVQYFGTPDLNAAVDIDGRHVVRTTDGESINVFVNVGGTLFEPQIVLTSDHRPTLPESEIISYLLFGAPSFSALQGNQSAFLAQQATGVLSSQLERSLISDLGVPLDYLRIQPPDLTRGLSGAEIAVGWQIGARTFVTLNPRICQQDRGFIRNWGASLDYRLSQQWHFLFSRDSVNPCGLLSSPSRELNSQVGVDIFWEKRY